MNAERAKIKATIAYVERQVRDVLLNYPIPTKEEGMELTRFDLQNQAIQKRIAEALERIAASLELIIKTTSTKEEGNEHKGSSA
jgi:hypothetical protein